jgi:predicted RNase H-like HicB family nuclease
MLTNYIQAALRRATYELLDDGTFYAEVPELQGLYANAPTLEACREELKDSLEEWIVLGLQLGHSLPVLDGISLVLRRMWLNAFFWSN